MNKRISSSLLFSVMVLLAWTSQVQAISTAALQQGIPTLAPMLEKVTPAVVSIRVAKAIPASNRFFFDDERMPDEVRRYFESLPNPGRRNNGDRPFATGAGSGVIVDSDEGYIITNHHVIDGASSISVQLSDGRSLEAELLGSDANTDVALLQITTEDLVDIELADIDTVQVGDYVVAIGNPFGIGQTVTSGIVSALGRTGLNNNNFEDFIQTDAAINLGNSGGALVDMEGRLIGINTAIISGSGGSNGIGFAVPADMVSTVMGHLVRDGEVRRGLLGVTIANLTPQVRAALGVDLVSGAVVTSVSADSAAERAGLQISDVIVDIDGRPVASSRELRNIVGLMRRDQEVQLQLYRNGEAMTVNAVIGGVGGRASETDSRAATSAEFRGAQLRNADSGVQVLTVNRQSRAFVAGLRDGDVIVEVNQRQVQDLSQFNAAVEAGESFAALTVMRDGRRLLLFVP